MKWIIIILVVLVIVVAAGLIWSAMKRKKDQAGRERAGELRSEAADTAASTREREARAREAEAEAARVRAQADQLEAHAQEERTSYDMTRARQEDAVREADRVDPDVDHRAAEYSPDLDGASDHGSPTHRSNQGEHGHADVEATHETAHESTHETDHETAPEPPQRPADGSANPVPTGPETIVPEGYEETRREEI